MRTTINEINSASRQIEARKVPVTDEELLLEYRLTGNRELYAQLVYRYERELFSYLRRYLGDAELAEDVFQAAFLAVHLRCETFKEGKRFRPWLYAIATNAAIDARRYHKRRKMISLDTPREKDHENVGRLLDLMESADLDPVDSALTAERGRLVRETVDQLPENLSSILHMVYFQGMSYKEAAEVAEIPVGTVKSRVNSAISKLTNMWNRSRVD